MGTNTKIRRRMCVCWVGSLRRLQNMDKHETALMPILGEIYGKGEEVKWFARWRGFFLACAECFFWDNGNEWFVSHYRFRVPK
eukprot:COSAG05_NODE_177_length_14916_cov_8.104002_14_plen_83_part_00